MSGTEIGDDTLETISTLPRLAFLDLQQTKITDAGLKHLTRLGLDGLYLGQTAVTDAGIAHLRNMVGLRSLSLRKTQVTDAALDVLKSLKGLTYADLEGTRITQSAAQELQDTLPEVTVRFPGVKPAAEGTVRAAPSDLSWLKLSDEMPEAYRNSSKREVRMLGWLIERGVDATVRGPHGVVKPVAEFRDGPPDGAFVISAVIVRESHGLGKDDWTFLRSLPNLESAYINAADFDDDALGNLAAHPWLHELRIVSTSVSDEGMRHVATMSQLKTFAITPNLRQQPTRPITDSAVVHLSRLPRLRTLILPFSNVTDAGLAQLAEARTPLTALHVRHAKGITDKGLTHLVKLPGLDMIDLSGTGISANGAGVLRALPELRHLHLVETATGDDALEALSQSRQLQSLYLERTKVSDAGLKHLSALNLGQLYLDQTQVTDTGVTHLAGMQSLQSLDLRRTQVTDASLDVLSSLKRLRMVMLQNSRVTLQRAQMLQDERPDMAVAFQGVQKKK